MCLWGEFSTAIAVVFVTYLFSFTEVKLFSFISLRTAFAPCGMACFVEFLDSVFGFALRSLKLGYNSIFFFYFSFVVGVK